MQPSKHCPLLQAVHLSLTCHFHRMHLQCKGADLMLMLAFASAENMVAATPFLEAI